MKLSGSIGSGFTFVISMIVILLYSLSVIDAHYLFIVAMATLLLIIYKYKNCKPIAVMFIFMMTYTLNLYSYFFEGVDISGGYSQFDYPNLYEKTLFYHTIFLCFLYLFLPSKEPAGLIRSSLTFKKNNFLFYTTFCLMVFLYFFGVSGDNIIDSGGYTKGETSSLFGLSLNEYFIVFLPIAYKFSNNEGLKKTLILLVSSLFCVKVLLFGGRVGMLQCLLMLFILYFDSSRLSLKKIILLMIPFIYVMLVFAAVRTNPFLVLEKPEKILMYPIERFSLHWVLGNQNDVFYSSVRLIGLVENGVISTYDRLIGAISFLAAPFSPYKFLPEVANLAGFMKDKYPAGGGALLSTYMYVYYSFPGLVVIAYFLSFVIKKLLFSKNQYWIMYGMMVLSTYPRWVGYNVISMFKMSFYIIPIYILLRTFHKILKIRNENSFSRQF